MKKLISILFVIFLSLVAVSCSKEDESMLPGTIYGIVTDKATGEPVKSAGVELSPDGFEDYYLINMCQSQPKRTLD